MTQVISVSANAAAIAMEVLKPGRRKGAKVEAEDNSEIASKADPNDPSDSILPPSETITAVSAQLTMLDSGYHNQRSTLKQAVEAYSKYGA